MLLAAPAVAGPFELKDGDRVVLLGATLIEQEQRYGYWETALTSRWPDRNVTFRNLGWSGDDVWGDARASFGTRADGFKALKDHVLALNPTVIFVGYGGNEAFDGPAGLPKFVDGLNVLLDTLAPAKARIVLLAPLRQEDLGRPLPDPTAHNKDLLLYTDALRDAAKKRGLTFADMNPYLGDGPEGAAADRRRLAPDRGRLLAHGLRPGTGLGLPEPARPDRRFRRRQAATVMKPAREGDRVPVRFKATDGLPSARAARRRAGPPRAVRPHVAVHGLAAGRYTLTIDGKPILTARRGVGQGRTLSTAAPSSTRPKSCARRSSPRTGSISTAGGRPTRPISSASASKSRGRTPSRSPSSIRSSPRRNKRSPNSAFRRPTPTN